MTRADEEPINPAPPRIARGGWLDALRFIVGSLIIVYHFRDAAPVPLPHFHPVFDRGYLLTDFFIIDSGYVLARVYGDRLAAGQVALRTYARQRLLRVIPAHLVVSLLLAALVSGAALVGVMPSNPRWFDWTQLPAQMLLVQAYGGGGQGWNAPTWTLSALIGCYLLLPWICRVLWRWPPAVVLAGVTLFLVGADIAASLWLGDPIYSLPMRYGILRALPLFLLGVAAAYHGSRVYVAPRVAGAIGVGAASVLVILQVVGAERRLVHSQGAHEAVATPQRLPLDSDGGHPDRPEDLRREFEIPPAVALRRRCAHVAGDVQPGDDRHSGPRQSAGTAAGAFHRP